MSQGYAIPEGFYPFAGLDPARVKVIWTDMPGPLPLATTVNLERNKQLWFMAGSLYRTANPSLAGVVLSIDGTPLIGSNVFINEIGEHHATIPVWWPTSYGIGSHSLQIAANPLTAGYNTDSGDRFTLMLIELESAQSVLRGNIAPPVVTSLPANPEHGQEIYYRVDVERVWHFRYDSTRATNKWVFLGGAAVTSISDSTVRTSASTGYVTLTGTPAFTAPFAGNFEVSFGAGMWNSATPNNITMTTVANLGVGAPDAWAIRNSPGSAGGSDSQQSPARTVVVPLTLANPTIELQYRVTGGTGNWIDRWMRVLPVNVGG